MDRLYQILEYEMNRQQAKAFKLALIWEEMCAEYFPRENCGKLPTKGDPRQSNLFRHCYKLVRTTNGIVLDDQYRWYIKAQLDILRNIKFEGQHANISPSCLVGDKAWARWKVWLKKFKNISKVNRAEILASDTKIIAKLKKTKEFLFSQFKNGPTQEDICRAFDSRAMIRWITVGKICGYYVLLSPFVAKCLEGKDFENEFRFDLSIYRNHIHEGIEDFFRKNFAHEFSI